MKKIRRLESELNPNGELLVPADTESGPAMITHYWYSVASKLANGQLQMIVNSDQVPLFKVMKQAAEQVIIERALLESKPR